MNDVKYDRVCDVYDSSNVETVAYSVKSKIMLVRFKTGAEYHYHSVPAATFGGVVCNESVGKAINLVINSDMFKAERIDN
jgi:hypothetical protein